ncbi:MAG TPA: insulinase family protein, partial [Flavobacterium sp.]|nr:insulinase family protein [Flavobacterium sp.]
YSDPKDVQYTQINFVDMPNAVQSEIAIVNISNLKMTDKDYFATILANQILGGDFNSYLNMNLREAHGWTYGARSSIRGNKYVSNFLATTQVRNAVTDSAVVEMIKEIKRIRKEKVTRDVLENVKAGYVGNFVMQIERPATIARYALQTRTQNLSDNFYENYIRNINNVKIDDVLKSSKKHIKEDNLRIIVVGKASDVLSGLESLNIPIKYFDKFGNPTEKPEAKSVSADITAKSVIEKYINAIGGKSKVEGVKTILSEGSTTIPGAPAPLSYTNKLATGKMAVEISMGGMSLMKQVVNDNTGYMIQQGQRMDLQGEMLEDMKSSANPFPELALLNKEGLTVKGIESIDGSDAYAVVDDKTTIYFDVKSGLKVSEVTETPQGNSGIYYKDYRDVNGVKVPYNIVMNVGFDLDIKMDNVKINEGVTDADFN